MLFLIRVDYCVVYSSFYKNRAISVLHFPVLVGAFSVFGQLDTGKPVQILGHFEIFVPIPGD